MRRLRAQRIEAMALAVVQRLEAAPAVRVRDRGAAVRTIVRHLERVFTLDRELDQRIRARIDSLARRVPEGSGEWEILYQQYAEELSRRRP